MDVYSHQNTHKFSAVTTFLSNLVRYNEKLEIQIDVQNKELIRIKQQILNEINDDPLEFLRKKEDESNENNLEQYNIENEEEKMDENVNMDQIINENENNEKLEKMKNELISYNKIKTQLKLYQNEVSSELENIIEDMFQEILTFWKDYYINNNYFTNENLNLNDLNKFIDEINESDQVKHETIKNEKIGFLNSRLMEFISIRKGEYNEDFQEYLPLLNHNIGYIHYLNFISEFLMEYYTTSEEKYNETYCGDSISFFLEPVCLSEIIHFDIFSDEYINISEMKWYQFVETLSSNLLPNVDNSIVNMNIYKKRKLSIDANNDEEMIKKRRLKVIRKVYDLIIVPYFEYIIEYCFNPELHHHHLRLNELFLNDAILQNSDVMNQLFNKYEHYIENNLIRNGETFDQNLCRCVVILKNIFLWEDSEETNRIISKVFEVFIEPGKDEICGRTDVLDILKELSTNITYQDYLNKLDL